MRFMSDRGPAAALERARMGVALLRKVVSVLAVTHQRSSVGVKLDHALSHLEAMADDLDLDLEMELDARFALDRSYILTEARIRLDGVLDAFVHVQTLLDRRDRRDRKTAQTLRSARRRAYSVSNDLDYAMVGAAGLSADSRRASTRTVARLLMISVSALPRSHRARYLEEFLSELFEIRTFNGSTLTQLMYCLYVLNRALELRAEINTPIRRKAGG